LPLSRETLDSIPGWFGDTDPYVISICGALQQRFNIDGDILEIGTYFGRSAVLLGRLTTGQQQLVVCDLFESPPEDERNAAESRTHYSALSRKAFENNYARVNGSLPEILQMHSSEIGGWLHGRTFRLIHVDGSHEWKAVVQDIDLSRRLLAPDGLIVFDDFRDPYAMGVAAAVWAAILSGALSPLVLTDAKLYASVGRPKYADALFAELLSVPQFRAERFSPLGEDILYIPPLAPNYRHPVLGELLPPVLRSTLVAFRERRREAARK